MAELHVTCQLQIARMATILRPLNKIEKLQQEGQQSVFSPTTSSPVTPAQLFLDSIPRGKQDLTNSLMHLSTFVINTLFNLLVAALYPQGSPQLESKLLIKWFKSYRDIMTLSTLKHNIYSSLCVPDGTIGDCHNSVATEAKFNMMQATFVTLLASSQKSKRRGPGGEALDEETLLRGQKTFHILFPRHFSDTIELLSLTNYCGLEKVTRVAMDLESPHIRLAVEGFLDHFFSPYRPSYHSEDVMQFLAIANKQEMPRLHMEMSVLKLYLGRILINCTEQLCSKHVKSGPFLLHDQQFRSSVGEVLNSNINLGPPGPYTPLFYQIRGAEEKSRMQQPLCHLYFLTVLEQLWNIYKHRDTTQLSTFVRQASHIKEQLDSSEGGIAILLRIELQAVIQMLIQELALHLDPSQIHRLGDVQPILQNINHILEFDNPAIEEDTAGIRAHSILKHDDPGVEKGVIPQGHGMVLALHLIKMFKSARGLVDLMTEKYDSLAGISCLKSIHDQLQLSDQSEMNPHLFPFLRPEAQGKLNDLYKLVVATMISIDDGSKKESDLVSLAQNYTEKQGNRFKRMWTNADAFIMMLWLATYYDFYLKKKESPILFNVVGSPRMSEYLRGEGYVRLIQCFLQPSQMQCKESSNSFTEQLADPIYQMFKLDNQFDIDLRHSLANLMAVILGSPPQSNHLWFHMFEADELQNSYMTGFMYDATISPEGFLYDCGVMLSPDGQFGRQDYKKHACRGTYTLHSLYLLLWANFGCFCMSLLTQPDSDQRIHGKIISKHLPLRDYCVSQLKTLWKHIRDNLGLSEEQRTFFVTNILNRSLQLFSQSHPSSSSSSSSTSYLSVPSSDTLKGKFETREELDAYEKLWHINIYQPVWDAQVTEFAKFFKQHQNEFFHNVRNLEMVYPRFALENELTHYILSSGGLQQHSEGGKLRLLATFTMEQSKLFIGEVLLPDLVELYLWLNKEMAHLLTYEHASTITIGRVINLAEKSLSKDQGSHIKTLYERVKLSYNQYVELTGGAIGATPSVTTQQNTISDDTPLLYFLTDVEEEGKGNDRLYVMIADIITNHNRIIENFYFEVQADKQTSFARFLPEEPPKILPTEVDSRSAIVSGSISYLQLIRSRYQVPTFQLEQLEEDVVSTFIAGKPLIKSPVHLRKIFKFKKDSMYTIHDLQDLPEQLPEAFRTDLPDHLVKYFEYEFHSANYHLLMEVVTALKTVIGHIVKLALEDPEKDKEELEKETVPGFMSNLYGDSSETNVLQSIGIQDASLSHRRCLANLPLTATYSCLRLFFHWVNEGFYDFCTLPFHFKAHLAPNDQQEIEELNTKWEGTTSDLKRGLQQLVDVLKHSEQDIIGCVNEADNPIVDYLIVNHDMLQENKNLCILVDNYIPRTIMLHHYVKLRLSLRRLQLKVQQELDESTEVEDEEKWQEFVGDLWNRHLPHLREELRGEGIYVFIENFCNYGFPEGESDSEPNMAALFSELAMEGGKKSPRPQPEVDTDNNNVEEQQEVGRGEMSILGNLEEKIKTDPELKNKVLSLFQTTGEGTSCDRTTLASQLSADYIAEFLIKIGLPQYAETFKENDVSGEVLLEANQGMLEELGVTSPSDQLKIRQQFSEELQVILDQTISKGDTTSCKLTADAVAEFLIKIELPQYAEAFKASNISGEVLLEASPANLTKLGVTSSLHQMIIMQLFQREVQGTVAKYPKQHLSQFLRQHKLDKYVAILEDAQIDGDMVLEVEEKLMESVLREVGVTSQLDIKKIRSKYRTFTSR